MATDRKADVWENLRKKAREEGKEPRRETADVCDFVNDLAGRVVSVCVISFQSLSLRSICLIKGYNHRPRWCTDRFGQSCFGNALLLQPLPYGVFRRDLSFPLTTPHMSLNEAETRYSLIDPLLRDKGYRMPYIKLETKAPVEPIGHKGRRRAGAGRTDYLLCVETPAGPMPLPVAILEAKKEDEDPVKGMLQAKGYSDCDRFDAKYIFSTNGHRYAKFNKFTGEQTGPFPFANFPDQKRLTD